MSALVPGAMAHGQIFHGRYEIVRCLKAGGMGAVYECIHLTTRKHRALKVMLPQVIGSAAMRERFELEARITAEIESEHIVETFDAGVDEATQSPFLVMELLRGEDLGATLKRRGPLPAAEVVLLFSQAAMALAKTHAAGIVHRDLKPDNLFLTTRDDGSPRLKILDFGIAKVVAEGVGSGQQTATIGTPLYMPVEQIRGLITIGPRSDLYALGHIAFALLTGAPYWNDELHASPSIFAFLERVLWGAPEPATARAARRGVVLPPAFDTWFARATAASPDGRFDSAAAQVDALAVALGIASPRAAPAVAGQPPTSSQVPLSGPSPGSGPLATPVPGASPGSGPLATPVPGGSPGSGPFVAPVPGASPGSGPVGGTLHMGSTARTLRTAPSEPQAARPRWLLVTSAAIMVAGLAGFVAVVSLRLRSGGEVRAAPTVVPASAPAVKMEPPPTEASAAPSASAPTVEPLPVDATATPSASAPPKVTPKVPAAAPGKAPASASARAKLPSSPLDREFR